MSRVTIVNTSQSFAAATRDNRRALLTAAMWLQLNHIEVGRVAGRPYAAAAAEGQAPGRTRRH